MHRSSRILASLAAAAAALVATALPSVAVADGFSTTNIQLLQGWNFDDKKYGYNTPDGAMTTLTLNHYSTWEYGDNFAFVDMYLGQFRDPFGNPAFGGGSPVNGNGAQVYTEWHPRLFLNKLLGQQGNALGIFKNWGLAGEVNYGPAFYAYLAGFGFDLALPHPYTVGFNVYYRYDRYDFHQWQVSPFWTIPFAVGPVNFLFTGFVDISGAKDAQRNEAIDVLAEPELLVDVLAPFGGKQNRLYVGCEYYVHAYPSGYWGGSHVTQAPQLMGQWTFN
jgi:nucleoside-specific outer membrane channel protein Tsx